MCSVNILEFIYFYIFLDLLKWDCGLLVGFKNGVNS